MGKKMKEGNLTGKIIGITLGIRHSRLFRVRDISGDIIDDILIGDKSPFNGGYFKRVQDNSVKEKTLFNDDNSNYLRINTDDIILGLEIHNDFDEVFKWIRDEVVPYFENSLFKKYALKDIKRVGVIFHHKLNSSDVFKDVVSSLTSKEIKGTNNFDISFSEKSSSIDGYVRKGINDYVNTIYLLNNTKDFLYTELDYQ